MSEAEIKQLNTLRAELSKYDEDRSVITEKMRVIEDKHKTRCCRTIVLNQANLDKCPGCGLKWTREP